MSSSSKEIIFHKLSRYPCKPLAQILNINFDRPIHQSIYDKIVPRNEFVYHYDTFATGWGNIEIKDFIYIFDNMESDASILCLNAYSFILSILPGTFFDFPEYDIEPYRLFLTYIDMIKSMIPMTLSSLLDLSNLWKRKDRRDVKINWDEIFAKQQLILANLKYTVDYDSYQIWRFKIIELPIVDMEPISSETFCDITGYNNIDELHESLIKLAQFKNGKKSKKYMNLDTNLAAIQPTWSKMSHHDDTFTICSQNSKRFSLIKAILSNENMTKFFQTKLNIVLSSPPTAVKREKAIPKIKSSKSTIPPRLREQVWLRDMGNIINGGKCFCCGCIIGFNSFHGGHIISEYHGGLTILENLKAVCSSCNLSMRTQNMKEFCDKFFPSISRNWTGTIMQK